MRLLHRIRKRIVNDEVLELDAQVRLCVTYTFATNVWLDPLLSIEGSDSPWIEAFLGTLAEGTGHVWRAGSASKIVNWAADDSSSARTSPDWLAASALPSKAYIDTATDLNWRVCEVTSLLHHLGSAHVICELVPYGAIAATGTEIEHSIERVCASLRPLADKDALRIVSTLQRVGAEFRIGGKPGLLGSPVLFSPIDAGHVMWHTRCVVLASKSPSVRHSFNSIASEMLPASWVRHSMGDSTYYLGNLVSCAVTENTHGRDAEALIRVTEQLNLWWTGTWLLDACLLRTFPSASSILESAPLRVLDRLQDDLDELAQTAWLIRSRIESMLLSTTGREFAIWEQLAEVWALAMNLDAVERKAADVSRFLDSVAVAARRERDQRLSSVIGVFTAVSVVASLVSIMIFVAIEPVFGTHAALLRGLVVGTTSVASVLWLILVGRGRRGKRARTGRKRRNQRQ